MSPSRRPRAKGGAGPGGGGDAPILTRRALNRATLARQMLLERARATPVEAVERLAGMQAQLARPPFVGLWSRLADFRRAQLLEALTARQVIRATLMRATIHLMSTADYVRLRAAIQPALDRALQSIVRGGLGGAELHGLLAVARAFFSQQPRTFDALREHLASRYPAELVRPLAYAVRTRLPLVQVATDATWGYPGQADFALAESWLGSPLATDADPGPLVLRYLAAFGPATVADFQTWTGLSGMRPAFETLRPTLCAFRAEGGRELFDLPDAPRPPEHAPASVRFLPEYDNLVLAHADRSRLFRTDAHRKAVFRSNLRILPSFLVDGFVSGTWSVVSTKRTAKLRIEAFEPLSRATQEALAAEGEGLLALVAEDAAAREVEFA